MRIDRASRKIASAPIRIYQALTSRDAVQNWLPPAGARAFEPRPSGPFRLTLTFEARDEGGTRKSSSTSDVVDGEFLEFVPKKLEAPVRLARARSRQHTAPSTQRSAETSRQPPIVACESTQDLTAIHRAPRGSGNAHASRAVSA